MRHGRGRAGAERRARGSGNAKSLEDARETRSTQGIGDTGDTEGEARMDEDRGEGAPGQQRTPPLPAAPCHLRFEIAPDGATGDLLARHLLHERRQPSGERHLPAELASRLAPLVARAAPAAAGELSYSRVPRLLVPGGGGLLCHAGPRDGSLAVQALYLPGGADDLAGVLPIGLRHSPGWDAPDRTEDVPAAAGRFSEEKLVAFARARRDRLVPFLADLRALFSSRAGRQLVVAEREPGTVAYWIALACGSLDERHARALTFTTCTDRPREAPQQILGIGPEARFDRENQEAVTHLYRVHDGLGGPGSPPPESDDWAERAARLWLHGSAPRLAPHPPPARAAPAAAPAAVRPAVLPAGPPAVPPPKLPPELPPRDPVPGADQVPGAAPEDEETRGQRAEATLEEAARRLKGPPHRLSGTALYRQLTDRLPGGAPQDAGTLFRLRRLVWGKESLDACEALVIVSTCAPETVRVAGLVSTVTSCLTSADEIDAARVQLARKLLTGRGYELSAGHHLAARVLALGDEAAAGGPQGASAAEQLRELLQDNPRLQPPELERWAHRRLERRTQPSGAQPPPPPG